MDTVWIAHPRLPDRQEEVPASSLPFHQQAGWELVAAPDTRPATIQALIDGGWDPDEARAAVEAAMPDPPPDRSDQTNEAPENTSGASSLPETPKGRRSTRGDS